jgi:hypothetical protein
MDLSLQITIESSLIYKELEGGITGDRLDLAASMVSAHLHPIMHGHNSKIKLEGNHSIKMLITAAG